MWSFIWRRSREGEEEEEEEKEEKKEDDDEDEDEEEEESFIFREVSAHRLVSKTHKTAGAQLYPLVIIPSECSK